MKKKVFVIIVTYNGDRWIKDTIQTLLNSNYSFNIVVIDNGSRDKTLEILSDFNEVKLIDNDINLGFGQANNIGIEYSQKNDADYIFLLNQDAKVEENTISDLVNILEENDDFGIVSPMHFNGKGDNYDYNFRKYLQLSVDYKNILKTKFINAAAWMVKSDIFLKYGVFSKEFFHYGEDRNYCDRLNYFNVKIGISKNSKVYHDREESTSFKKNLILSKSMLKCSVLNINKNIIVSYLTALKQTFGLPKYYFKNTRNSLDSIFTYFNLLCFYIKLLFLLPKMIIERNKMKIIRNLKKT